MDVHMANKQKNHIYLGKLKIMLIILNGLIAFKNNGDNFDPSPKYVNVIVALSQGHHVSSLSIPKCSMSILKYFFP